MPLGNVIDIVGSIYAPEKDQKTNKPINHKKLQDVFNKLDSVINNDLAEKSDIPSSTEEQRYYDSNDDLVARDVYLETKSYSGNTITGIFRQENTGTNDSPVWETRYVFDQNDAGALHLNANTPGIVFPDGSTVNSDAFNGSGQVHKYKGKDLDGDGDGRVDDSDAYGGKNASAGSSGQHLGHDGNGPVWKNDNAIIPSGTIVMWSGTISDISSGWVLCDGNNGTPDLTDRFVVGSGNNYTVGDTGGSKTHGHGWGTDGNVNKGSDYNNLKDSSHLPPYYAVAFIMKT